MDYPLASLMLELVSQRSEDPDGAAGIDVPPRSRISSPGLIPDLRLGSRFIAGIMGCAAFSDRLR